MISLFFSSVYRFFGLGAFYPFLGFLSFFSCAARVFGQNWNLYTNRSWFVSRGPVLVWSVFVLYILGLRNIYLRVPLVFSMLNIVPSVSQRCVLDILVWVLSFLNS